MLTNALKSVFAYIFSPLSLPCSLFFHHHKLHLGKTDCCKRDVKNIKGKLRVKHSMAEK